MYTYMCVRAYVWWYAFAVGLRVCECALSMCALYARVHCPCMCARGRVSVCGYAYAVYVWMRVLVFCAGMGAQNNFVIDIRTIC